MPLPGLLSAQVVTQYRRQRVVRVKHRVVFGTREAMAQVLAAWGWKINTSFVERLNLDLRQRVAAIGRRVNTLSQGGATVHAGDGGRIDRSRLVAHRGVVLPGTAVPSAADGLKQDAG